MRRCIFTLLLALFTLSLAVAQNDSLRIVRADWRESTTAVGIKLKQAQIKELYGSTQSISLVEIAPSAKRRVGIAGNAGMIKTSEQATSHGAVAAINGSFYDMKKGNSVCFYKVDGEVIDSTTESEFNTRVTGAVREKRGKVELIAWSREIEQGYTQRKGTVLASGPMLMEDGRQSDWSSCREDFITTRHPRSAIFTKADGTVVLLTVDGRSEGNAAGMSIPELAYLVRVLGAEDALNLDGGGSTTLWIKGAADNGVVNYPCDNKLFDHRGERSVSNIIYVK
ncbi:MAG: phosphodiester glycosidase family protein [Rikenellaceae bacterium]|nr:phosphodiester glycosidase family protein [Rikenellaceae bacterium]